MRTILFIALALAASPLAAAEEPDGAYVWLEDAVCDEAMTTERDETEDEGGHIEGSYEHEASERCDESGVRAGAREASTGTDASIEDGGSSSGDEEVRSTWSGQRSGPSTEIFYNWTGSQSGSSSTGPVASATVAGTQLGARDACDRATTWEQAESGRFRDTNDSGDVSGEAEGSGRWHGTSREDCASGATVQGTFVGTERHCEGQKEGTYEFEWAYEGTDTWSDTYTESGRSTATSSCRTEHGTDGAFLVQESACAGESEGTHTWTTTEEDWTVVEDSTAREDCERFDGIVVGDTTAGRGTRTSTQTECVSFSECGSTSTREGTLVVDSPELGRTEVPLPVAP